MLEKNIHQQIKTSTKEDLQNSSFTKKTLDKKDYFFTDYLKTPKAIKISPLKDLTPLKYTVGLTSGGSPLRSIKKNNELFLQYKDINDYKNKTEYIPTSLTPNKTTLKHKYDDWGKIVRAESVKYHKEVEMLNKKHKINKLQYSSELIRQATEYKNKNFMNKKEREEEEKRNYEQCFKQNQDIINDEKKKKELIALKQKQELDNFIYQKTNTKKQFLETKKHDKEYLEHNSFEYLQEELKKRKIRDRIKKKIAKDN